MAGTLRLSAAQYAISEASGNVGVTVDVLPGTEVAGTDYQNPGPVLLNFAAAQTSKTVAGIDAERLSTGTPPGAVSRKPRAGSLSVGSHRFLRVSTAS